MDHDSQIKLLTSNIEKLEKLVDDLNDNVDSKRKKINFLKEKIELNIKTIDFKITLQLYEGAMGMHDARASYVLATRTTISNASCVAA